MPSLWSQGPAKGESSPESTDTVSVNALDSAEYELDELRTAFNSCKHQLEQAREALREQTARREDAEDRSNALARRLFQLEAAAESDAASRELAAEQAALADEAYRLQLLRLRSSLGDASAEASESESDASDTEGFVSEAILEGEREAHAVARERWAASRRELVSNACALRDTSQLRACFHGWTQLLWLRALRAHGVQPECTGSAPRDMLHAMLSTALSADEERRRQRWIACLRARADLEVHLQRKAWCGWHALFSRGRLHALYRAASREVVRRHSSRRSVSVRSEPPDQPAPDAAAEVADGALPPLGRHGRRTAALVSWFSQESVIRPKFFGRRASSAAKEAAAAERREAPAAEAAEQQEERRRREEEEEEARWSASAEDAMGEICGLRCRLLLGVCFSSWRVTQPTQPSRPAPRYARMKPAQHTPAAADATRARAPAGPPRGAAP